MWSAEMPRSEQGDRKSTRLNSSHLGISYAVFCLKKKKTRRSAPFAKRYRGSSALGQRQRSRGCTSRRVRSRLTILFFSFFFFNDTATTEIYTLSLHDALPISARPSLRLRHDSRWAQASPRTERSEEHTSELQSLRHLVCRLLLEKKKKIK